MVDDYIDLSRPRTSVVLGTYARSLARVQGVEEGD